MILGSYVHVCAGRQAGRWVGRQANKNLAVSKMLKSCNFTSKARLGCLNGFMALVALLPSYQ